jgi:outer membrane cobalamin receptor
MVIRFHEFLRKSRGIFYSPALIILILALPRLLLGQEILKIYGQVISRDGAMSGVSVVLDKTPYNSLTDNNGFYYFYNIPVGVYSLSCRLNFNHYKLAEDLIVEDGPAIRRDIYLDEGVINIAPIVVTANRYDNKANRQEIAIDLREKPASVSEIIAKIPGLNVLAAGDGGELYVAPNGARPEALEVYVDGRKINSILTGKADLNQIPLGALRRVEYYPTAGAINENGGLAGRLDFISGKRADEEYLSIGASGGSFGRSDYDARYNQLIPGYGNIDIGWEHSKRKNNYKYIDYFGEQQIRRNADYRSDKVYFGYAACVKKMLIKLSGYGYDGSNGIPGKTVTPSLNARSDKFTLSTGGEVGLSVKKVGAINMRYSCQNRKTEYRDSVGITPYLTQYNELENTLELSVNWNKVGNLRPESRFAIASEKLEGKDNLRPAYALGIVKRNILGLGGGIGYSDKLSPLNIECGISGGADKVKKQIYSSYGGRSSLWVEHGFKLGMNLSYGKSYRLPGLAELNWKEDVFVIANPDLRPERSFQGSIGTFAEFPVWGRWRLSAEYRDVRYRDLIYWRRSRGLRYKPVNIARSDCFAASYTVLYRSPGEIASVEFSRVNSVSLNREEGQPYYGKRVIFQPSYVNRIRVSISYELLSAQLEIQDVGERYYLEENTKALAPYTLINLGVDLHFRIDRLTLGVKFKADNITNTSYELLEYQPMPPRTWGLGMAIKI